MEALVELFAAFAELFVEIAIACGNGLVVLILLALLVISLVVYFVFFHTAQAAAQSALGLAMLLVWS